MYDDSQLSGRDFILRRFANLVRSISKVFLVAAGIGVAGCGTNIGGSSIPQSVREACSWVHDEDIEALLITLRLGRDDGYPATEVLAVSVDGCTEGCVDGGGVDYECGLKCTRCVAAMLDTVY